jgi:hypothetical protein
VLGERVGIAGLIGQELDRSHAKIFQDHGRRLKAFTIQRRMAGRLAGPVPDLVGYSPAGSFTAQVHHHATSG